MEDIKEAEKEEVKELNDESKKLLDEFKKEGDVNTVFNHFLEDDNEVHQLLKKNNFDFNKTYRESVDTILKSAKKAFFDANVDKIKFFLTSDTNEENKNPLFDIKIGNITYHFKDEFFIKADKFETTIEGAKNEFWIVDLEKVKEYVTEKLPDSLFVKDLENLKKKDEKITLDDVKAIFYNSLYDIIFQMINTAKKEYEKEKISNGDVKVIEELFDVNTCKLYLSEAYELKNRKDKSLFISNKSNREGFIKKMKKDYKNLNIEWTDELEDGFLSLIEDLTQMFVAITYQVKERKEGIDRSLVDVFTHIKGMDIKEKDLLIAVGYNVIAKRFNKYFMTSKQRMGIPALIKNFADKPVEQTLITKRFYEIANLYYDVK